MLEYQGITTVAVTVATVIIMGSFTEPIVEGQALARHRLAITMPKKVEAVAVIMGMTHRLVTITTAVRVVLVYIKVVAKTLWYLLQKWKISHQFATSLSRG